MAVVYKSRLRWLGLAYPVCLGSVMVQCQGCWSVYLLHIMHIIATLR